jgi:hypothetical protein
MWAGDRCPHCGCPLDHVGGADPQAGGTALDVEMDRSIEILQTEVAELRATVARLRGSGFTGAAPTGTSRR